MLMRFKNILLASSQIVKNCGQNSSFCDKNFLNAVKCDLGNLGPLLSFHTTPRIKSIRSEEIRRAAKDTLKKDLGTDGAYSLMLDSVRSDIFPTYDLPEKLFDGVPFKNIPVVNIKCSRNNTILYLCDKGSIKISRSCGTEGFKNTRKGTNVAAQAAGTALGLRAIKKGYKNVRVVLKGLGPGRITAMKGLDVSGINIISVTDDSTIDFSQRPKKERRI